MKIDKETGLKPCPFCGQKPKMFGRRRREYVDGEWAEKTGEEYWVKPFCKLGCLLGSMHSTAYGIIEGQHYISPEAAAKAWNTRYKENEE